MLTKKSVLTKKNVSIMVSQFPLGHNWTLLDIIVYPWVPCVLPGLWGPQGARNYLWGALSAMQSHWAHRDLLVHTTQGWF